MRPLSAAFVAVLFCTALAVARPAAADTSPCVGNGDIVTFEGTASASNPAQGRNPAWVLHLFRPVCVVRRSRRGPSEKIFAIRIIGTPPPLDIPLQLTGKLLLGRTTPGPTMFAALAVISGRKGRASAPSAPGPLPANVPSHSTSPPPNGAAARCNSPPYGGTQTDYQAFVGRFGQIIRPQKILAGICNAKFGNAPRDGLHKLGFTDAKIDSEGTERLAAETIVALKKLVNTIE